jgi:4-aminobutyrate aminotransferase/(S)-3-amino-2-methylpropionate transaminase
MTREMGFDLVPTDEVRERGIPGVIDRIHGRTGGAKLYVSFDVDFVDPAYAPGTGTPEIGGFTSRGVQEFVRGLADLEILGCDVVEVYPPTTSPDHGPPCRQRGARVPQPARALEKVGTFHPGVSLGSRRRVYWNELARQEEVATMLESTRIKTEIPGPKSRALMERRHNAVSSGVGIATPMFAKEAKGALLTDVDGNTFIDFGGGIGVMNVGHTDSRVVEAVKEQAERLTHSCFYVTEYEGYLQLAEKLNALIPGDTEKRSFFVNSGAEAVENAAKIARYHTGRPAVIAFENSFHGRTMFAMTLTGKTDPYKKGFGPFVPEVYRVPAPYAYRCPAGRDCSGGCRGDCFASIEKAFVSTVHPSSVAAIIVEPVSGEGGFIPFPDFYLRRLRDLCDEHGIVMIVDEVQTGFGRTGKMFAIEHSGVEPDIITTAKSMGGGLPIAGVTGKAEIMDSVHVGGLGTTYGGNPIACAAALAVLEAFEEEDLLARANVLGERVMAAMREIQDRHPDFVGDVRGRGPMAAMEFVKDAESRTPDKERTAKVIEAALQEGLLLLSAGQYGNCIRTLMPFVITDEELEEGLAVLGRAVDAAA